MLSLSRKTPQDDGFFITGTYGLAIVPITDGVLDMTRAIAEFTFAPNPTDIDDDTNIPNSIEPDQAGGFFTNVNEAGEKTLMVRGTTGHFPVVSPATAIAGEIGARVQATANLLGITQKPTGYQKWMELNNFVRQWFELVRSDPHAQAMLFINHKDAEFYQVLPMQLRKTRSAARPLQYQYALTLRVLAEHQPAGRFVFNRSWVDRMNDARSRVARWRYAINNATQTLAYLMTTGTAKFVSQVMAPVQDITNMMNTLGDGIQALSYTANTLTTMGSSYMDRMASARENVYRQSSALVNSTRGAPWNETNTLRRAALSITPPTRGNVAAVFAPVATLNNSLVDTMARNAASGPTARLNPDDPAIDQYGAALELLLNGYLAEDSAPLRDMTPTGSAAEASRHMHQAARAGAAGKLNDQTNAFTSARLAAETTMIEGVRNSGNYANESKKRFPISYIAAVVLQSWARSNDAKLSPELNSFRRAVLGMRDPSTLAPVYKVVQVQATDTVYSLAARHLGTWRRWFEIVLLNDLRYPYISTVGGLYCRTPGEKIYIPLPSASVPVELLERLSNVSKVHDLVTLQDLSLGFDVEIGEDGDAVFNKYDYAYVVGVKAFEQELKFVLEGAGGISSDPTAGPPLKIGSKSRGRATLALWRGVLQQWLSNDPRVDKIEHLQVVQNGDAVYFYTKLVFKGTDSAVVLAGDIRPR